MPAPISSKDGASLAHGRRPSRRASRRLLLMVITTGKVPMIMVGKGPPARPMALDKKP